MRSPGSFIPATTAAASSWSASSAWRGSSADAARSSTSTASAKRCDAVERAGQHPRRAGGRRGVRRGRQPRRCRCSGQPSSPALASAVPSSSSKPRRSVRRRRLGERTAQEHAPPTRARRSGRPSRAASTSRSTTHGSAAGSLDQQVLGDALGRAWLLGEQPSGASVALRALGARELLVEAGCGRSDG